METPGPHRSPAPAPFRGRSRIVLGVAGLAAAAAGLVAFATPRPLSDLYIALAGGRDVLAGKLGSPDDWSFATGGAVWINQNWGGDLLIFLAHRGFGDPGLLALKGLLLVLMLLAILDAGRLRGAPASMGLLAGALALAASPPALILRPNLFTLLLLPVLLGLLYRSRSRPHLIWGAALLLGVWANLHGGFVIGLAVLFLWCAVHVVDRVLRRAAWPREILGATLVAFLLAGLANPFGLRNLELAVTFLGSPAWKGVTEWRPVFGGGPTFETPWIFIALGALTLLPGILRLLFGSPGKGDARAVAVFEALIVLGALGASFFARRFIVLAALLLAPILAHQLAWLLAARRFRWPAVGFALGLAAVVLLQNRWLLEFYDPDNPRRPPETFFERSVYYGTDFPDGIASFLELNQVSGRVFQEYRWEGFLRWRVPDLKLFVGGRAQQVYADSLYFERREILKSENPLEELKRRDIHLVAVPLGIEYAPLCQRLLLAPGGGWVYIYNDRHTTLLGNALDPAVHDLVDRLTRDMLEFPDPATRALSRGMCLASPAIGAAEAAVVEALDVAVNLRPTDYAYPVLADRAQKGGLPAEELLDYLENEQIRLNAMPVDTADGLEILKAREDVARLRVRLYDRETQSLLRSRALKDLGDAGAGIRALRSY